MEEIQETPEKERQKTDITPKCIQSETPKPKPKPSLRCEDKTREDGLETNKQTRRRSEMQEQAEMYETVNAVVMQVPCRKSPRMEKEQIEWKDKNQNHVRDKI